MQRFTKIKKKNDKMTNFAPTVSVTLLTVINYNCEQMLSFHGKLETQSKNNLRTIISWA